MRRVNEKYSLGRTHSYVRSLLLQEIAYLGMRPIISSWRPTLPPSSFTCLLPILTPLGRFMDHSFVQY